MSNAAVAVTGRPETSSDLIGSLSLVDGGAGLAVTGAGVAAGREHVLHPVWLRERSLNDGALEAASLQRMYDPSDLSLDLTLTEASLENGVLSASFSDGHSMTIAAARLATEMGWASSTEAPPAPVAWPDAIDPLPVASWATIVDGDDDEWVAALGAFWRHGFVVLHDVPTTPGTVAEVANRLGNLVPTNHGVVFDVVSVPDPVDLAYTPIHLNAHCDGPYRKPGVTIQLLHCLRNEAPGGNSTLVDGLAAANALAAADPVAYEAATTVMVEYRYDTADDVIVSRAPMIELHHGEFHRLRFSHRLDYVDATDRDVLDAYYRARRWMRDHLNDPAHQTQFRLESGHLMVMDNLRILHGRTAFDAGKGHRHLQGCYVDHDGLDTNWRLARRRQQVGAERLAELATSAHVTLPGGLD